MLRISFNRNTDKGFDIRQFSGESSMLNNEKKIMALGELFRACIQTEMRVCTDAWSSNDGSL